MIDMCVIRKLELISDTSLLDMPPKIYLKNLMEDIIKYEDLIRQMYAYPISDGRGLSEIGKMRTAKHDAIISKINMLRRVCEKYELSDPFNGAQFSDRHEYAVAAMDLLTAILKEN